MLSEQEELKLRAERDTLVATTKFLLYERREETEVRNAFAALLQERHNTFHDKEGEVTEFTQCANDFCIKGLTILQGARKARVEVNELTIELIRPFNLKLQRDTKSKVCVAYLEEPDAITHPEPTLLQV